MGAVAGLPIWALVVFGVVGGGAIVILVALRSKVRALLAARRLTAEAGAALEAGELDEALERYVAAGRSAEAAEVAYRLGRLRQAIELFSAAGQRERADAVALEANGGEAAPQAPRTDAGGDGPSVAATDAPARPAAAPAPTRGETHERARIEVERYERARSQNDDDEVEELARGAAEACLQAGNPHQALSIFNEARLINEAINLHANVLGDAASAAALLAIQGEHDRAAELFEAAGEPERALAAWIRWAVKAPDPLLNLARIERLGNAADSRFLVALTDQRFLDRESAGLFYTIADLLERRDRLAEAAEVFRKIEQTATGYRDVSARLSRLRAAARRDEPRPAPSHAPGRAGGLALSAPPARVAPAGGTRTIRQSKPPVPLDDDFWDDLERGRARGRAMDTIPDEAPPEEEPGDDDLREATLLRLAGEVASAAARDAVRIARPSTPPPVRFEPEAPASRAARPPSGRRPKSATARGLEPVPLELELVADPAVAAARSGPSVAELETQLGKRKAGDSDVEGHYRLGLARAATGRWREARESFAAAESASPGFRDAARHAAELARWQEAIDGAAGRAGGGPKGLSGRYTILGEVGRGGMAVVYRARDVALGREVALKFLSEEVSNQPPIVELFQREARSAAQLNHPNIVTVYDVGSLDGRAFICMELVEGKTVEQLLEEQGKLTVYDALRVAENILSALDFAHSRKIVHRDIKPSNMMRNELGVVKLMDFGLAKSVSSGNKTTIIAGTPLYMAPEQFTGRDIDARTDVFAFGASLYEMLTGQTPFEGMRRDPPPAPPSQLNPAIPEPLERLVERSLQVDREKRFKDAGEMLRPTRKILAAVRAHVVRPSIAP